MSAAAINGRVLACSGLFHRGSNDQYLGENGNPGVNPTDCFAFDPAERSWTRVSSILHGVDHAAVGVDPNGGAAGRVYVFGGRDIGRNIGAQGIALTQVCKSNVCSKEDIPFCCNFHDVLFAKSCYLKSTF